MGCSTILRLSTPRGTLSCTAERSSKVLLPFRLVVVAVAVVVVPHHGGEEEDEGGGSDQHRHRWHDDEDAVREREICVKSFSEGEGLEDRAAVQHLELPRLLPLCSCGV